MRSVQELVVAIRRARQQLGIAGERIVEMKFAYEGFEIFAASPGSEPVIELLARVRVKGLVRSYEYRQLEMRNAKAAVVNGGGATVFLLDVVDVEADRLRLQKQAEKLKGQIGGIERKLGNEGFVAKAPPAVIAKERASLEALQSQLAGVEQSLRELG